MEVNFREHHTIYGIKDIKYAIKSEWYTGEVLIPTYELAELLGTKMRVLYQRRKGTVLFDMWFAIRQKCVYPNKIVEAWNFYMEEENNSVTQKEFLENMEKKILDQDFLVDMKAILRPDLSYKINDAFEFIKTSILERL